MNNMGGWSESIEQIISAIRIDSPERFNFAGLDVTVQGTEHQHGHHQQGHHQQGHAAASSPTHPLVNNLSGYLYEYAYSRPFRGTAISAGAPIPPPGFDMVEAMSAANSTRERWEEGWSISQIMHHGQVMAQRGNETRTVWPGQFISKDGPAAVPRAGAQISLFYAKESRSLQNGFYYAFGEEAEDTAGGSGLVRLYWNISAHGAPRLVGAVTSRLNRFQVPFRMKCAVSPSQYGRTDVAVIYLAKRFFRITAELLLDIHPADAEFLDEEVPLFSKAVARGVGVAEDPGTGESFGQSRCRCLAQGVWDSYLRGAHSPGERADEFRRLLVSKRIDPEHPHLNAGSLDWYELPQDNA
jgi:hypothetical protein